jgi:hypothetical protein
MARPPASRCQRFSAASAVAWPAGNGSSSAYSLAVIVGLAGIRNPPGIATAPSQP